MAQEKVGLKAGMKGSSAGRERSAKTGELKQASKKARRRQGVATQRRAFEDR
jgi:hypothetical protein